VLRELVYQEIDRTKPLVYFFALDLEICACTMFWLYLALAGLARLVVEFSRVNLVLTLGLTEAQWFSVAMIIVGTWQLLKTCHGQESCNYLSRPSPNYW
jgi:prolipoprotein diacylglyceryltransferase